MSDITTNENGSSSADILTERPAKRICSLFFIFIEPKAILSIPVAKRKRKIRTILTRSTLCSVFLSDLGALLQWLVLEHVTTLFHISALTRCDNTPACSWATRMFPKSRIGARLVRALALRQRIRYASPMATIHVAGKDNDIADIPSRSIRPEHR
eukprot:scaffold10185_cov283-Chaetoceros_neogracile.AAC.2